MLGILWSFALPLAMLAIYTFVFSIVFKARWQAAGDAAPVQTEEFALILFAGLSIHMFFSECMTRAPGLILNHASYVTRVVFPLEILPAMMLISAAFHYLTCTVVLLVFVFILKGSIPFTALWLPVVILPAALLLLGVSWLLSSLGVFLRDLNHFMQLVPTILLFLSPIFYPASALPAALQPYLLLNPLTAIAENARAVLIFGQAPDFAVLAIYMLVANLTAIAGYAWFQRTRKAFADVL